MMAQTFIGRKRVRKFFGKIEEVAEMPNLIEVQKASYDQFLLVVEPHGGRNSSSTNSSRRNTTSTSAASAA
jgi:DNA-directed RNA polymerase subunit beta